jgi:hypothetical protein
MTFSCADLIFSSFADHTALSSFTSEASLLAGTNQQPRFPVGFFDRTGGVRNRSFKVRAAGVVSCTGTPTYTFTARIGGTVGSTELGGTAIAASAAITCQSGITSKIWELELDFTVRTPGQGANNCTLAGTGFIKSPAGFAAPYIYALAPSGGDSATWTSTINAAVENWLNLSVACSASSASNAITCKDLLVWAWN